MWSFFTWVLTVTVFLECRTMERHRHRARGEEFDYPPMDHGGFSPSPHPPPWLEPPPPYEVAIKTTCSSTHLRRAYSDTHLATEPLFGQSREISFEVWGWTVWMPPCTTNQKINRHETGAFTPTLQQQQTLSNTWSMLLPGVDQCVLACFPLVLCNYDEGVNAYLNLWWN